MTNAFEAGSLVTLDPALLRTRSRADFVYESLRDAISEGRIACGERVREEEIARNLGVSRTPVREALGRLRPFKNPKVPDDQFAPLQLCGSFLIRGLQFFGPGCGELALKHQAALISDVDNGDLQHAASLRR